MHYRVSLRHRVNGEWVERTIHKSLPRLDNGMQRALEADPRNASVLIKRCWDTDDECEKFENVKGSSRMTP